MIYTGNTHKISDSRAKRYRSKLKSRDALQAKITDLETKLQSAKTKLGQVDAKIKTTVDSSRLPILISTSTSSNKESICSIIYYRTTYVYYLLDLDTVIEYAWRGNNSDKHSLEGTLDLSTAASFHQLTRDEIVAEIKKTVARLKREYKPQTWAQLKKLLKEYYQNH